MSNARDLAGNAPSLSDSIYKPVATGTLANGQNVVLNADGTVQAVTPATAPNSTAGTWSTGYTIVDDAVYDTTNNRIIMVYRDSTNSYYGTVIVGTVSGTTITFGTPAVYQSTGNLYSKVVYNIDADLAIITNTEMVSPSYPGKIRTATILGTSITVNNVTTIGNNIFELTLMYDHPTTCTAGTYQDGLNNNYGTLQAYYLSGTNIYTIQSPIVYDSVNCATQSAIELGGSKGLITYNDLTNNLVKSVIMEFVDYYNASVSTTKNTILNAPTAIAFLLPGLDPSSGKVVLLYRPSSGGTVSNLLILTVNGDVVTATGPYQWESVNISYPRLTMSNGQFIITYSYFADSYAGKYIVGTISQAGDAFFSTAYSIGALLRANTAAPGLYDPDNSKAIIFYTDAGNLDYGTYTMIDNAPSNAYNFIGITNEAIADGEAGAVSLKGSINQSVTGLTTQADYYVQDDGTLSTTATPTFAGKALSPTSILLKGI
jgi:hypothetical protein